MMIIMIMTVIRSVDIQSVAQDVTMLISTIRQLTTKLDNRESELQALKSAAALHF